MSNEKFTALESAAIIRKRKHFEADISRSVQPIVERYLGMTNSGTIANQVAEDLSTKYRERLQDAATSELIDRVGYLMSLLDGEKR